MRCPSLTSIWCARSWKLQARRWLWLWTEPHLFSWRCMQRTVEVCPYKVCMHSPVSAFQTFNVRSVDPLMMILSLICEDQTPPVCPTSVLKHWKEMVCFVTLSTELKGNLRQRNLGANSSLLQQEPEDPRRRLCDGTEKSHLLENTHQISPSTVGTSTTRNFSL